MTDSPSPEAAEVATILSAYLDSDSRVANYASYFTQNPSELAKADPLAVGMLIATCEGVCDNPPLGETLAASVATWAYLQVGTVPAVGRQEFAASVKSMLSEAASQRSGALLATDSIEELADGYGLLGDALIDAIDPVMARATIGVASILNAVQERAELDWQNSHEGTVVVETVLTEWLLDNTQAIIDYAAVLLSYEGLNVNVKDDIEDALAALRSGFDAFTQDAG